MRIGVYLGDLPQENGGGFTFQDEIRRAILEGGLSSRHSFVLFSSLGDKGRTDCSSTGASATVHARAPTQKSLRMRRAVETALGPLSFVLASFGVRSPIERCMRNHQIDLAWFVTPVHCELDIPYIATVWDLQHRRQPWFPEVSSKGRWRYRDEAFSGVLARAAMVLVPNETGKQEAVHFFRLFPENVRTLPHPTPGFAIAAVEKDPTPTLDRLGLEAGSYFFYPSQFWPHKNHATLLRALVELREIHGLTPPLVLTGSDKGNREHVDRAIDAASLRGQVRLPGFVSRDELVSLYRGATALVYPTLFGPENLPPLEAFALGCPVIASRVAGADEQLGDAALLVPPTDAKVLAEAMRSMLSDGILRAQLREKGLARAGRWTSKDYVRAVVGLCDDFEPIRRCWPSSL